MVAHYKKQGVHYLLTAEKSRDVVAQQIASALGEKYVPQTVNVPSQRADVPVSANKK